MVLYMTDTIRLTVNMSKKVLAALEYIAKSRGISMTEVLRQAISHEKLLYDAHTNGEKILTMDECGNTYELLLYGKKY